MGVYGEWGREGEWKPARFPAEHWDDRVWGGGTRQRDSSQRFGMTCGRGFGITRWPVRDDGEGCQQGTSLREEGLAARSHVTGDHEGRPYVRRVWFR